LFERPGVVGLCPRAAQPALDLVAVTVGEVVKDVALFVDFMAMSP
jgi:hypothetical protein